MNRNSYGVWLVHNVIIVITKRHTVRIHKWIKHGHMAGRLSLQHQVHVLWCRISNTFSCKIILTLIFCARSKLIIIIIIIHEFHCDASLERNFRAAVCHVNVNVNGWRLVIFVFIVIHELFWNRNDFKCVWNRLKSRLSLTHHMNKSNCWVE